MTNDVGFVATSVSQQCHARNKVIASTSSFPQKGGNPERATAQDEAVSGNEKEPGGYNG